MIAPDKRVDPSGLREFVQIACKALEWRGARALAACRTVFVLLGCGFAALRAAGHFGDAVCDVVHDVYAGDVLLLEEVDRLALLLGEDRDEHVCARHFFPARGLDVEYRALKDALKS